MPGGAGDGQKMKGQTNAKVRTVRRILQRTRPLRVRDPG